MARPVGSKNKKSVWLLESLAKNGYDYEKMLTGFLEKAAKGNHTALSMAQLLVKMVPYVANMPKTDTAQVSIDTLVINRYDGKEPITVSIAEPIDTEAIAEPNNPGALAEDPPISLEDHP